MAGLLSCLFFIKLGRKQLLFLNESGAKDVRNSFAIDLFCAQPSSIEKCFSYQIQDKDVLSYLPPGLGEFVTHPVSISGFQSFIFSKNICRCTGAVED